MATITSNATGGGNWGTTGTWSGSVVPVDNDTVVIAAGDTVTFDANQSGFANGIAGLTITSHATTPAMLRFKYDADGTYYLKIKTATTIAGTNAAARGRLLVNSDGTWGNSGALAFGRKVIIDLQGTAKVDALYLDVALYCTQPTNTYAEIYGTCYVVTCAASDDKLTFVSPSTTPPQAGTPITLDAAAGGALPAELTAGTTYFIRDVSGSTCKLEATIGGGAINLTTDGSGTIYLHYGMWGPVVQSTAVNTTTGVITWNGVPPAAGTIIGLHSTGTLPAGFSADAYYYIRSVSGNTCKLALQNADLQIVIPWDAGTGNLSMYFGHSVTTTAVVNTVNDISVDAAWITTDGYDHVVLVDVASDDPQDAQKLQLTTITARYLVLSANVDSAQAAGSRLYLMSRNVSILSATTTTTNIVDYGVGTHSGVFQCEIRVTSATAAGTGIYGGGAHTISGTISNCTYGVNSGSGATISGIIAFCPTTGIYQVASFSMTGTIAGCGAGISTVTSGTVSGEIRGCKYGMSSCSNVSVSGLITGCPHTWYTCLSCTLTETGIVSRSQQGINSSLGNRIDGTIMCCTIGMTSSGQCIVTGTITGCTTGISAAGNITVTGTISYCTTAISGSTVDLRGATITATCGTGMTSSFATGSGAILVASTLVASYKHSSLVRAEAPLGIALFNFGNTNNYLGFWTLGGFTKTAAYSVGTHIAPPVASTFIHEMTFEDSDRVNWVEFPVYGLAGQAVTVTFYGRLTATSLWTTRPNVGIYDPTKQWQTAPEILNASAAMASNTDWQTLTATYTPTYDRELRIRVQGVGGNAGGTGTEKLYWFHTLSLGAAAAGGLLTHPGMAGGMRG